MKTRFYSALTPFYFIFALLTTHSLLANVLPVDITFLIADFKYNERQGVQICEVQPGSVSVFEGYDYLNNEHNLVQQLFFNHISFFELPVWYFFDDVCNESRNYFLQHGWIGVRNFHQLLADRNFITAARNPVFNPNNILEYHGILYGRGSRMASFKNFSEYFPGIILLDAAIFPYSQDKYLMNQLLSQQPVSNKLKPLWNLYPCHYSSELVRTVLDDIPSSRLVIKPRHASRGVGVIIVDRNELDNTLQLILEPQAHPIDPDLFDDPAYSYWLESKRHDFIVEEFVESDPVNVEWFDNQPYDGTVRAVILLTYNEGNMEFRLLEAHWKLPKKSILDEGSLTEKHKSYGKAPHFYTIESDILQNMETQLKEGILAAYQSMLGINPLH